MQGGAAECETMLQVQKRAWGALLQAAAHKSRAILGKSQAHSAGCGMQEQGQRRRACSGKMAHMAGESMCCCTTACITSAVHFSGAVPGQPQRLRMHALLHIIHTECKVIWGTGWPHGDPEQLTLRQKP